MQKHIGAVEDPKAGVQSPGWLSSDLIERASISSENASYPLEDALNGEGQGWRASESDRQTITLSFKQPQALRHIYLRFDEPNPRTQEFLLRWSNDGGVSYHDLRRQQFNFSASSSIEEENYTSPLIGVTDLELLIIPDISHGPAVASLKAFRFL